MKIRKHFYVNGMVQGVGFRYRAYHIARAYGLTGYASNLDDGRVELEVQGEVSFVNQFLERVAEGRFISIEQIDSYNMSVRDDENTFETY